VRSSFDGLWALVRDVARVAGLFPYTQIADLRETGADTWVFTRHLQIPNISALCWQEEARVVTVGQLQFQAIAGDLQTFSGCWQVTPDAAASSLTLTLEYAIPEERVPNIPAPLVQYVVNEVFKTICLRIKEAAEEETV
jgi:ribosome-associated toxin RatA of RatAB toxin-antitoxin module